MIAKASNLLIVFIWIATISSVYTTSFNFSREFTGVTFDPYVSIADYNKVEKPACDAFQVIPLLEKVSTKFTRVLLKYETSYIAKPKLMCTPVSAATLNKLHSIDAKSTSQIIQLWIQFHTRTKHILDFNQYKMDLNIFKALVNKANTIYEGTVPVLLILGDFLRHWNHANMLLEFRRKFQFTRFQYKMGLTLNLDICWDPSMRWSKILSQFEIVLFSAYPSEVDLEDEDMNKCVESIQKRFSKCKDKIHRWNRTLQVGFITRWPDTTASGYQNVSNLVQFWKEMNAWAINSSTTLIFDGAFDRPVGARPSSVYESSHGWWRLLEDSSCRHPYDYTYEEKINSTLDTFKDNLRNITWLQKETMFSRENVLVQFDPYILKFEYAASVWKETKEIIFSLLEKTLTSFSMLITPALTLEEYQNSHSLLPSAVANYNKWNSRNNTNFKPLQVILTVPKINLLGFDYSFWNFHLAQQVLANPANKIFPGTVKTILAEFEPLLENFDKQIPNFFKRFRKELSQAKGEKIRYKLGVTFPLEFCSGKQFHTFVRPLFAERYRLVSTIQFLHIPSTTEFALGLERSVSSLIVRFELCQNQVRTYAGDRIELIFNTWWWARNGRGEPDYPTFVKFWEIINNWAVKSKSKVVPGFAFESFIGSDTRSNTASGWWRPMSNNSDDESEFDNTFENAKEIALKLEKSKVAASMAPATMKISGVNSFTDSYTLRTWELSLILTASVFLFVLVVVLGYIYVRKVRQFSYLSAAEIHEFFYGDKNNAGKDFLYNGPFDKEKYELKRESFFIDYGSQLGSGAFGKVCRAKILKPASVKNLKQETSAAVKLNKSSSENGRTALRGLLSEIKILAHLGQHENIVSLLGAYTGGLSKGKVFVFLELCELGCLQAYLHSLSTNRKRNTDQYGNPHDSFMEQLNHRLTMGWRKTSRSPVFSRKESIMSDQGRTPLLSQVESVMSTDLACDMFRWCCEIVNGMEFLASKRVVHADLATRNVLLTSEKQAKISDFGLSRRLYNYSVYAKKQHEPLPWRWMAPESLRRLEFTEKTDVWAFGITLWEIYSLGELPYPGLCWDFAFPTRLERGLRLEEPMYNDQPWMYTIMLRCWSTNPGSRPTFARLKSILQSGRS